ncbi:MAG: hypothetical protein ACD_78C00169G0003 [uncultured bacterium (gcode 4)]|uniref:Primosomal protein N n=1 Tax=uncultured bacterium (gcode 4) TaxID=1234023 RepID=K1YCM9_9BACT|nr:MAG: hypothetical protein ACD_78C00169G0003 [uncultured bacterium (gcode 4)]
MFTIIDLNYEKCSSPFLSDELIKKMRETIEAGAKCLLFFNRRWSARTLICKDCGYQFLCDRCDLAMIVHSAPEKKLLCHHCAFETPVPHACPKCHGTNLLGVGFGIQKVEDDLRKLFPDTPIARIDSDKKRSEGIRLKEIQNASILLSTELGNTLTIDGIELVAFLLLESEMAVPEYDIEEKIYTNIAYNARKGSDIYIQTYIPSSDLIKHITEGNYRDFLVHTLAERKTFRYPPYGELVHLWVRDPSKERIRDIIYKLKNKLEILKTPDIELYFDREIFTKRNNEYGQKIVLKWLNLSPLLATIAKELFRNRWVSLERK